MTDTTIETIDITPTWEGLLLALLLIYTNPGPTREDKEYTLSEMQRMARLADLYVAEHRDD